jgi:hypothetical protein
LVRGSLDRADGTTPDRARLDADGLQGLRLGRIDDVSTKFGA